MEFSAHVMGKIVGAVNIVWIRPKMEGRGKKKLEEVTGLFQPRFSKIGKIRTEGRGSGKI